MEQHRERNIKESPEIDLKSYLMAFDYTVQDSHKFVVFHLAFDKLLQYNRYHETQVVIFSKDRDSRCR